jgi:toxin CcdB
MARFDVYQNPDAGERASIPYWLDVQNTFLEVVTRVVVPLHAASRFNGRIQDLNPGLVVQGKNVVMNTAALGAVPTTDLRAPITNLVTQQNLIQEALDTLFAGY